ncbi:MAG: YhdH/YhfP family quinone oxidoreductase [Pseudomonadota bacterium]|nr:YhdH/YhfP family quinone oxidoreductase [Pseudomonadota bacterium]
MKYKALVSELRGQEVSTTIQERTLPPLSQNEVLIKAHFSSLNFKDALGITGRGPIFKSFPRVGGIDVSGVVYESKTPHFMPGDKVLVTGCGLGENYDGGFAQYVRVASENVISLPAQLTLEEAMIYGTAGFTAALCLSRLMTNGQSPDLGPIAVTGASGGVGSFAIYFLSHLGFKVVAISGKPQLEDYLLQLGAHEIISFEKLKLGSKPLETVRFGGAIDNVGGETLSKLCGHTQLWGNIACVGLTQSHELKMTVMPLILRGVSLLGISSNNCPNPLRRQLWQELEGKLKPKDLSIFKTEQVGLDKIVSVAHSMLERKTHGRVVVKCES